MKNIQKGFTPLILLIIVLAVGGGGAGFYVSSKIKTQNPIKNKTSKEQTAPIHISNASTTTNQPKAVAKVTTTKVGISASKKTVPTQKSQNISNVTLKATTTPRQIGIDNRLSKLPETIGTFKKVTDKSGSLRDCDDFGKLGIVGEVCIQQEIVEYKDNVNFFYITVYLVQITKGSEFVDEIFSRLGTPEKVNQSTVFRMENKGLAWITSSEKDYIYVEGGEKVYDVKISNNNIVVKALVSLFPIR